MKAACRIKASSVKMGENGGNEQSVINESMNMNSDSLTCDDKLFVVSSLVNRMNLEMLRVKTHQSLLESDTFDRGAFSFFKVAVAHMMLAKACVPVVAGDIMPGALHSESQACGWNSACETEMTRRRVVFFKMFHGHEFVSTGFNVGGCMKSNSHY